MFQTFEVNLPSIKKEDFPITAYGAVKGGEVSNTKAFAEAIAAAAECGGRVVVPDGMWLTGPIELKSGVELHLEDNAVILFSKNPEEYPLIVTDFEGIRRIRTVSPISAKDASDIAITGNGVIDGNGHLWRPVKSFKVTARQWDELLKESPYVIESKEGGIWVPTKSIYDGRYHGEVYPAGDDVAESAALNEAALEEAAPYYDFYRPVMVHLYNCERVLIENVTVQNSPAWCLHPHFCKHLTIKGVRVNNPYHAQNGDALDVESCENVEICYCTFSAGDDGICIKSGKDKEARKIPGPCQNIHVHHCKVGYGHGGFVIGSEMSRGVRNVLVEDCTFINSDVGLRFKSAMGRGGVVEDIYIRRINMLNLKKEVAIFTMNYVLNTMDYEDAVVKSEDPEDIPEFRNVYIEDCCAKGAQMVLKVQGLEGKPDTIHDIYIKNCDFEAKEENSLKNCRDIVIR